MAAAIRSRHRTGRQGWRCPSARKKTNAKIEFGDFQTPLALAKEVCSLLVQQRVKANAVLEPTCGVGTFLVAAAEVLPKVPLLRRDFISEHVIATEAGLADV